MANMFGSFALPIPEAEVATLYTKSHDKSATDDSALATILNPKETDVAVIDTMDDDLVIQKNAYWYNGTDWVAITGPVCADNIVLSDDIPLAGNYTQVGNITKTQTGTGLLSAEGKTLTEILNEIFWKRVQPNITSVPSLSSISISTVGEVEAGTALSNIEISAPTFSAGSYTFGPSTGITPTYSISRVTNTGSSPLCDVSADGSATDSGPITIGDQTGDATELYYTVTAFYEAGATANDNIGDPSNPAVAIAAGSTSSNSGKITSYRKAFYGTSANKDAELTSAFIRGLNSINHSLTSGNKVDVSIPEGAKLVVFAIPAADGDLSEILDTNAMNTNLISVFTKEVINVEGANSYTAVPYNVYSYRPNVALARNTYSVKIS